MSSTLPPLLCTPVPGPCSRALGARLARVESRGITAAPDALPPIFWQRAQGSNVWDVDGNRFVDLAGAFGVANVGHAHPRVVAAIARQSGELLHAMSELQPAALKVELLEKLCARFPGGGAARAMLGCSGSDAVELALKTALLFQSERPGVVAFEGGYHGLSLGALDLTWREDFRAPFRARLAGATGFARYGDMGDVLRKAAQSTAPVGAVIVEPIQGRGGDRLPAPGFLRALRQRCDEEGWLLIADEIYSGFGRTGRWFACEHEAVVPDLLCVGKGLASGMPISACLGKEAVMNAWPPCEDEAIHTQTFLGHPASCAAALASLQVLEEEHLVERAAELGARTLGWLTKAEARLSTPLVVRGSGLMIGIECETPTTAASACSFALERGVIVSRSGEHGRVLSLTPPLSIDEDALRQAITTLLGCIE